MSFFLAVIFYGSVVAQAGGTLKIPAGSFTPFDAQKTSTGKKIAVDVFEFELDILPVTNSEFLRFVSAHPEWRKSQIKSIFADAHYLNGWSSDLEFGPSKSTAPVTQVSWFAASAYCQSEAKELPTSLQWEFALYDQGRKQSQVRDRILAWYGKPNDRNLSEVGSGIKNGYGLYDLDSLIWEWTSDFNSSLSNIDSRDSSGKDSNLFCGNGSLMGNPADYAAFMRYSFRASLKANFTTASLGFRCAKERSK